RDDVNEVRFDGAAGCACGQAEVSSDDHFVAVWQEFLGIELVDVDGTQHGLKEAPRLVTPAISAGIRNDMGSIELDDHVLREQLEDAVDIAATKSAEYFLRDLLVAGWHRGAPAPEDGGNTSEAVL